MNEGFRRDLRLENFDAAQARTCGGAKSCDSHCGAFVLEQREKINRERVGFKQSGKQPARRVWVCCRRLSSFADLSQFGEGVQEFETRLRLMRLEAGEIASLVTAPGDQQIVTLASNDAAQIRLARRSLFVRVCGGKRKANVAFDGGDNPANGLSRRFHMRTQNVPREVFCLIQDGEQRPSRVVYS